MIKAGDTREAKYWGKYTVKKVVELPEPRIHQTKQWGLTRFRPTIVEIEWEKSGDKEFWFPYWIGPVGKERFGQYAPMVSENQLLSLLQGAIKQAYFSQGFMSELGDTISRAVAKSPS